MAKHAAEKESDDENRNGCDQPDLLRVWDGMKVEQSDRKITLTVDVPDVPSVPPEVPTP